MNRIFFVAILLLGFSAFGCGSDLVGLIGVDSGTDVLAADGAIDDGPTDGSRNPDARSDGDSPAPDASTYDSGDSATTECPSGLALCGADQTCVDQSTDRNHCGRCGNACTAQQVCVDHNCVDKPQCDSANPASCVGLTYCSLTTNRCEPGCDPRNTDQCGSNATCSDNRCQCTVGFHACGTECVANASVNSCGASCSPCSLVANATQMGCDATRCTVLSCSLGYEPNSAQSGCTDINECLMNNGGCDVNASCRNTAGSRICSCNGGFNGDGLSCVAVSGQPWQMGTGHLSARPDGSGWFGNAIALSENGLVLALSDPLFGANRIGAVHLYTRNSTAENFGAISQTVTGPLGGAYFGQSVSLSADGLILVVSDSSYTQRTFGSEPEGRIYLYTRRTTRNDFGAASQIISRAVGQNRSFAGEIALSADARTLAVLEVNINRGQTSVVHIYARPSSGQDFDPNTFRTLSPPSIQGAFGNALSLSRDGLVLAAGTPVSAPSPGVPSRVYVYARSTRDQAFSNPHTLVGAPASAGFGFSVSLSSDGLALAVGEPDVRPSRIGTVHFYTRASTTDVFSSATQPLVGTTARGGFGGALALRTDGRELFVGEDRNGCGVGPGGGCVFVFER